jgi:hypothetical protein
VLEILLGASTYTGVVWSLGCIFAKIAREKNLFGGHSKIEV